MWKGIQSRHKIHDWCLLFFIGRIQMNILTILRLNFSMIGIENLNCTIILFKRRYLCILQNKIKKTVNKLISSEYLYSLFPYNKVKFSHTTNLIVN